MINVFQPSLGVEELEAVRRVFESNWLGKGKLTESFEEAFAVHLGVPREHLRSTNSCSEGLFLSLKLIGAGPGDEIVMPSISFVASANAAVERGAKPVFCDVDPRTLNATAKTIEAVLSPRTKAVLLIHYGGLPAEMDPILDLLRPRGIHIIEDSACSVASAYKGRACGTLGDIGVWSFDPAKVLVTGDGGMVYVRDPDMARRVELELYLGLGSQSGFSKAVSSRWWEFDVTCAGRRGITNDICSAIGLEQLKKLGAFLERRAEIDRIYRRELAGIEWLTLPPEVPGDCRTSHYFHWIQVPGEGRRDRLATYLRGKGIYTTFRYHPLHRVAFYEHAGERLPCADQAAEETLLLPIHQALTDSEVERILDAIRCFSE
ncbi:MAG: DegT/DnrJ/EryC1/StrS family aminotransferase [Planctomycetes bacterium]|nr:DegT/DnrJ/EryC1/StrS family aminotransferase [Planctomycetota bacterium]